MAVVDDDVGTELLGGCDVRRRDGGGDGAAQVLGELDRDRSHATGPAVDEDGLALFHLAHLDEGLPGRERDNGEPRGLDQAYRPGRGCHRGGVDRDELGEGARGCQVDIAVHVVAHGDVAYCGAGLDDLAGELTAHDFG